MDDFNEREWERKWHDSRYCSNCGRRVSGTRSDRLRRGEDGRRRCDACRMWLKRHGEERPSVDEDLRFSPDNEERFFISSDRVWRDDGDLEELPEARADRPPPPPDWQNRESWGT